MKLVVAIVSGCLLLTVCAFAQPHGKGKGFGPDRNPARVSPKPTPRAIITVGKKANTTRTGCDLKAELKSSSLLLTS
jgi:hypothetical protein